MTLILLILDGWGLSKKKKGNAIVEGKTPFLDILRKKYPTVPLKAAGKAVGLPNGYMGNSEVGHITLGAGRVVPQMLLRINNQIKGGTFLENEQLNKAISLCKKRNATLHLMGLFSDKGVHSHEKHAFALLKAIKDIPIAVHVFTDGRDTKPTSAKKYLARLQKQLPKNASIATISGRYYAMDRDNRWDRTKKAYDAIVHAEGRHDIDWKHTIDWQYAEGKTDEFFEPTVLQGHHGMNEGDVALFFNFRLDRGRQLSKALTEKTFTQFSRKKRVDLFPFAEYYKGMKNVLFAEPAIKEGLGEVLAKHKKKQLRLAETEKYAHVTYFFNGQKEQPFPEETRKIIPSPKVATYDATPQMSTEKITDYLLANMHKYDVCIVNFSNGDMIGHTGNYQAALKAVHIIDNQVKRVTHAVHQQQGTLLIAADHGNCEEMKDGRNPLTAHTRNSIPFTLVGKKKTLRKGGLADVAPTILELLNLSQPKEMTGRSLLK